MRRVPPSVIAREELEHLLHRGAGPEENLISALVQSATRLVVQSLLEADQTEYLGGRGRYERRPGHRGGSRNGYIDGHVRTAEGDVDVRIPQVRGAAAPYPRADGVPRGQLRRLGPPGVRDVRTRHVHA